MSLLSLGIEATERGLIPDLFTRAAIRRLCGQTLSKAERTSTDLKAKEFQALMESMRTGPIALVPEKANEQHYELPPEFFAHILGPHRKYSSCYWPTAESSLFEAEVAALKMTAERANLGDNQEILELGCGWGSLTLWMAEKFPFSRITAVSNSLPQREFIESEAATRGFKNLKVITSDINQLTFEPQRFDRVVSVEMFEHMRNYERLLEQIFTWLRPSGSLFVHHFCHHDLAYPYEVEGEENWMGRNFFTGGLMPSENLLRQFDKHLSIVDQWRWDGTHYQRTSEAWLANLDSRRREVLPILEATYGPTESVRWLHRWRVFFLAVAELFGYAGGTEWFVSQSLLKPHRK